MSDSSVPGWMVRTDRPSVGRLVASMTPTAMFLVVDIWASVVAAILASTVVAVALVLERHRRGVQVGWIVPVTLGYVVVRGVASATMRSDDVYFGLGVVASAAVALVVLGTAFTRSPVAVYAIPFVKRYDSPVLSHPRYRRVAAHVTAVWALCELGISVWEMSHLRSTSAAEFVALRSFVGWPAMVFVVFWLIFYVRARLDPLEYRLRALPDDDAVVDRH